MYLFSFLPVSRFVVHLTLKDSPISNTLNCIHRICKKKNLNHPFNEYCQCEENWSGEDYNQTMSCPCVGGSQCVDGYLTPICVYPLGRIRRQCRVLFNPCSEVKCTNGGTCLTLDQRRGDAKRSVQERVFPKMEESYDLIKWQVGAVKMSHM